MDKISRPERFDCSPDSPNASKESKHWHQTFKNFLDVLPTQNTNKLIVLTNFLAPAVSDKVNYDDAIKALEAIFIKEKNIIFARHLLATRKRKPGESVVQFIHSLKELSRYSKFQSGTAEVYREKSVRDALINGLSSSGYWKIRHLR